MAAPHSSGGHDRSELNRSPADPAESAPPRVPRRVIASTFASPTHPNGIVQFQNHRGTSAMTLSELGFDARFTAAFAPLAGEFIPGRISVEHRNAYMLLSEQGEIPAELSGRMHHTSISPAEHPAVGDWVAATLHDNDTHAIIHHLLPRRSAFVRHAAGNRIEQQILAANIDTVFIVAALDAEFNPR